MLTILQISLNSKLIYDKEPFSISSFESIICIIVRSFINVEISDNERAE